MGFLGTVAFRFAEMVLIMQVTGFVILFASVIYVKKGKFLKHFTMARIVVSLGIISLIWMGFSLMSHIQAIIFDAFGILLIMHATIGLLALSAGILFALDRLIEKTFVPMRVVFLLWAAALFLGVIFYIGYYGVYPLF